MLKQIKVNKKNYKIPGYLNMPVGGIIIKAGNSTEYETGQWSTKYPIINKGKCSNCLLCYMYCPEKCITINDNKVKGINLNYCKGCGICLTECPRNAIEMRLKD